MFDFKTILPIFILAILLHNHANGLYYYENEGIICQIFTVSGAVQ